MKGQHATVSSGRSAGSSVLRLREAGKIHFLPVLTDGFHSAFLAGAGIAALGLVATLTLIRGSDSRAHVALGDGTVVAESAA